MKKYFFLFLSVFTLLGFSQGKVKFQAEIENRNSDEIVIKDLEGKEITTIKTDKKGKFKSEIAIPKDGFYILFDGTEYAQMYLKNGYDIKLKLNAKEFDETLTYTGKGAEPNNFIAKKNIETEQFTEQSSQLDNDTFLKLYEERKAKNNAALETGKFDEAFTKYMKKEMFQENMMLLQTYKSGQKMREMLGKPSPTFEYENFDGSKTKLESLKGKYVYIDVWATWCGPCRAEIPHLQEVEEKYKDKNIAFVSISVDEKKDYEKWKKMVADKKLGGIQLIADNNWQSDFIKAYGINSIPRFILLDPEGKIIQPDAERPSSIRLTEKLDELLK